MHPEVRTPESDSKQTIKRRGLLTAAAAFVAGLVAKFSEARVFAGSDGDVVLGVANISTNQTSISNTLTSNALFLDCVVGDVGVGLESRGSKHGVIGDLSNAGESAGAGVLGYGRAASYGVWGFNNDGVGVYGRSETSNGVGLLGQSTSGIPVLGQVAPGSSANTIAIYALNTSSYAGAAPGAGGFGIYGLSAKGHGLVGATATAGGAAVVGATNGVPGAYAGVFYGPVVMTGAFTVFGAKSAAVPHPDGTRRRLYCLESPESWFEDFGTGRLDCGAADVTIDPDFAALVDLKEYHVFVTQYDQHNDLYVTERTSAGFRVQAADRASDGQFSWRVVAKRRDIAGERLPTGPIPPELTLPPVPDLPAPIPTSDTPQRRR